MHSIYNLTKVNFVLYRFTFSRKKNAKFYKKYIYIFRFLSKKGKIFNFFSLKCGNSNITLNICAYKYAKQVYVIR